MGGNEDKSYEEHQDTLANLDGMRLFGQFFEISFFPHADKYMKVNPVTYATNSCSIKRYGWRNHLERECMLTLHSLGFLRLNVGFIICTFVLFEFLQGTLTRVRLDQET